MRSSVGSKAGEVFSACRLAFRFTCVKMRGVQGHSLGRESFADEKEELTRVFIDWESYAACMDSLNCFSQERRIPGAVDEASPR